MMSANGTEVVMTQDRKIGSDEAQDAFVSAGARSVNVRKVEESLKAFKWIEQNGAKALAVAEIMQELGFWGRVKEQYDPIVLGEITNASLEKEDLMEYIKMRKEITMMIITAHKEIVRLVDQPSATPNRKGVKASISPVMTVSPLVVKP
jgi:ATP:corrinoid adenosyltransferase